MMLTGPEGRVDGPVARVSLTELARLKGVSKQAISKRLDRLVAEGLIRKARIGREVTVSLAEWDTVTNEVTDPARLVARDTQAVIAGRLDDDIARRRSIATDDGTKDPSYTEQLTRKAGLEADLKAIELARQRGTLLPVDDVRRAMEACAEALVRDIGQLSTYADDVAAAVARNGASGARDVLRACERRLRETLARTMTLLGDAGEEEEEAAA